MLDASGIIHIQDDLFLVAEDEKDILRFFKLNAGQQTFVATGKVVDFGEQESDFEALAYDPDKQRYYCIGSHGQDYSKRLVSFQLSNQAVTSAEELVFDSELFIDEPIDIEALSVWQSKLFIGLRRPSRKKQALAVLFDPEHNSQLLTLFNLQGRTFRDMVRIDDANYLILAGPQRGKDYKKLPPIIIWWNGDLFNPQLEPCQVNLDGFRAEGIAVRQHATGNLDILLGSDESKIKKAKGFRMLLCQANDLAELKQVSLPTHELSVVMADD